MKSTLVAVAGIFVFGVGIALWSEYPQRYLSGIPITLGITVIVVVLGAVVGRVREAPPVGGLSIRRASLTVVGALVAECALLVLSEGGLGGELGYYAILAGASVVLRSWCGSDTHSPVLLAVAILVLFALGGALHFGLDPVARSEYGPERWLFAMWGAGARLTMAPLDASVAWLAAQCVTPAVARASLKRRPTMR